MKENHIGKIHSYWYLMLNGKISIDDLNTNDSKTLLVLLLVLVPALCLLLIAVLVALRRLGIIRDGGSNSTFTGLDPADSQSSPPAAEVGSGLLRRLSALVSKLLLRCTAQATNESAAGPSSFEPFASRQLCAITGLCRCRFLCTDYFQ